LNIVRRFSNRNGGEGGIGEKDIPGRAHCSNGVTGKAGRSYLTGKVVTIDII
jgi:hypothetical protein